MLSYIVSFSNKVDCCDSILPNIYCYTNTHTYTLKTNLCVTGVENTKITFIPTRKTKNQKLTFISARKNKNQK